MSARPLVTCLSCALTCIALLAFTTVPSSTCYTILGCIQSCSDASILRRTDIFLQQSESPALQVGRGTVNNKVSGNIAGTGHTFETSLHESIKHCHTLDMAGESSKRARSTSAAPDGPNHAVPARQRRKRTRSPLEEASHESDDVMDDRRQPAVGVPFTCHSMALLMRCAYSPARIRPLRAGQVNRKQHHET